ncbi:unnamed protein product [Rotaria sordida]|nr:unnamed protein product [Rotaria sordida]CAF1439432.1 unnamed protein product [Rotaria sordida]
MHPLDEIAINKLDPLMHRIIHDIASALYILETKQIIHRDVKPANMLINKNAVVKLCDFGICGDLTEKLDFRTVEGTFEYLPPDPEPDAIHDDMWALGISSLEIVSGQHPFTDWIPNEIPFKILNWEPTVPMTVSYEIQQLILHLLKRNSQERPHSYIDILNKSFICNVLQTPSNDECDFVRGVIEKIPSIDNFKQ